VVPEQQDQAASIPPAVGVAVSLQGGAIGMAVWFREVIVLWRIVMEVTDVDKRLEVDFS
jgi:hypothetical protein